MARAHAEIEIDAPPAAVMAVLVDWESYPAFLPWIDAVSVLRRERGMRQEAWEVRFDLQLIRPLHYTLRLEREGEVGLRWTLVEGIFRANDGGWALQPLDEGTRTRAAYDISLQVGSYVPAGILRSLTARDLPDLLVRVRDEVLRRQGS
ncbi:MAG: SRPBCC family protein [Alphaproteobacteria bacterium]|nr:SRPBCC family protein [Alphaproteobacteria bacterium]